ncbi:hypothetical protein D3C81_07790 [compost metagenome]
MNNHYLVCGRYKTIDKNEVLFSTMYQSDMQVDSENFLEGLRIMLVQELEKQKIAVKGLVIESLSLLRSDKVEDYANKLDKLEDTRLTFNEVLEVITLVSNKLENSSVEVCVYHDLYNTEYHKASICKPQPLYLPLDDLLKDMTTNLMDNEMAEVLQRANFM